MRLSDRVCRFGIAGVAIVGGSLAGCTRPAKPVVPITTVRIATGLRGMTFKPLGDALVEAYRRVLPDVNFIVVETEGSVSNLDQLQAGTADLGLALADAAYMAYNGHIAELHGPAPAIRGVAVLHASTVHVLVSKQSAAKSITDLRGMRLGVGASGSGTAVTSAMLLRAFGVPSDDVRQRTMPFRESVKALTSGDLDAVFIASADPVDVVTMATQAGARLLDVTGDTVQRLRREYPFLRLATIPAGTYPGQTLPIQTVREDVLLLCREQLDDVLVHRLTSALFDVLPAVAETQFYLGLMDIRRAPATPVPLHSGAAWYYREQELSR